MYVYYKMCLALCVFLEHNLLILWNECLHDAPCEDVGNGADAEDNHVGSRLALETKEGEGSTLTLSIGEELTRTLVDEE